MQCDRCDSPLIEINHYGGRLTGCLECNVWIGNKGVFAIRAASRGYDALGKVKAGIPLRPIEHGCVVTLVTANKCPTFR